MTTQPSTQSQDTSVTNYSRVFKRLCHMAALTKEGKERKAIDNLVLTTLAIDDELPLGTVADIREAITTYFGISLSENTIQSSIDRHMSGSRIVRDPKAKIYTVSAQNKIQIENKINESISIEETIQTDWYNELEKSHGDLFLANKELFWTSLRTYMTGLFHQHGAETTLLLNPKYPIDIDFQRSLSRLLRESVEINCKGRPNGIKETIEREIRAFFGSISTSKAKYLAQLLDGTFTFFALSSDEFTANYLKQSVQPISVFLDTNFIFGILGLHSNALVDVSKELIDFIRINKLPLKLYYHEDTLDEIRRTILAIGDKLKARKWSQSISRAAIKNGFLSSIEFSYHQKNADMPTDPEIFLARFDHIPELLREEGFVIYRDSKPPTAEEKGSLIAHYDEYIKKGRPDRAKPYEALDHDIVLWLAVQKIRRRGFSILESGAIILSADYIFRRFDWNFLRKREEVGTVVLPNNFLQLLRPFVPSTDDFDKRFVETFAIPQFRTVGSDYEQTCHSILSYLSTYSDVSEGTASRILASEMIITKLNGVDENSEEFKSTIEHELAQDHQRLLEERDALEKEHIKAVEDKSRLEQQLRDREQEFNARTAEMHKQLAERLQNEVNEKLAGKHQELTAAQNQIAVAQAALQVAQDEARRETAKAEALHKKTEELAASIEQTAARSRSMLRATLGIILWGVGLFLLFYLPAKYPWEWLQNHQQRLGLYGCAASIWTGLSWAVGSRTHKEYALGPVALAAFLVLLQIIGH